MPSFYIDLCRVLDTLTKQNIFAKVIITTKEKHLKFKVSCNEIYVLSTRHVSSILSSLFKMAN